MVCQIKVQPGYAACTVSYEINRHTVIDITPLWMVPHLLGYICDGLHKCHGGYEVAEYKIRMQLSCGYLPEIPVAGV